MDAILQYGVQGVLAFGAVGAVSLIADKRFGKTLSSEVKLYLLVGFAFAFGFIPADLGNEILDRLKVAIAVGVGINALNTGIKRLGGNE